MSITAAATQETFLFLTQLAYKSRVTLPILILCGCLLLNMRIRMELTLDTERLTNDEEDEPPSDLNANNSENNNNLNSDDDSRSNEFDELSLSDSEISDYLRTVICLEVEIDHFYTRDGLL